MEAKLKCKTKSKLWLVFVNYEQYWSASIAGHITVLTFIFHIRKGNVTDCTKNYDLFVITNYKSMQDVGVLIIFAVFASCNLK